MQVPRTTWQRAVWSLSPFALRLGSYLIAICQCEGRDPAAAFTLSSSGLPQALACKAGRVTAALDEIAASRAPSRVVLPNPCGHAVRTGFSANRYAALGVASS